MSDCKSDTTPHPQNIPENGRRRYQDRTGRNVLLNKYKASEGGTKMTVEYGIFF